MPKNNQMRNLWTDSRFNVGICQILECQMVAEVHRTEI